MGTRLGSVLAAAAVVVAALGPGLASAHAAYKDSDPADRSSVPSPPGSVWAEFTEPPSSSSTLEIYDPCGTRVDARDASVSGHRITVSMNGTHAGTYTARFSVVSALDGHATSGTFVFTSTGGAECRGGSTSDGSSGDGGPSVGRKATTGSGGAAAPAAISSNDRQAAAAASAGGPGRAAGSNGGKHRHRSGKQGKKQPPESSSKRARTRPLAQQESGGSDLPLDWLLVSFGISAAIGAVGGRVYASLSRPRRKPSSRPRRKRG